MSGFNIHTGMPTMHGGLTGHGIMSNPSAFHSMVPSNYHSLGGYLIGGAKVADMTPQQLAVYRARLLAQKQERAAARLAKGLAPYGSLKGQPRGSRRKYTAEQLVAREGLKHLRDAEESAAFLEEQAGNPDYAKWLVEDQHYNDALYSSNKTPAWLTKKYNDPDPFGLRLAPARRQKRESALQAAKERREAMGMTKVLNPNTGRMVYPDSKIGQRVLHNVGFRARKGVDYGNAGREVYGYAGPNPYR